MRFLIRLFDTWLWVRFFLFFRASSGAVVWILFCWGERGSWILRTAVRPLKILYEGRIAITSAWMWVWSCCVSSDRVLSVCRVVMSPISIVCVSSVCCSVKGFVRGVLCVGVGLRSQVVIVCCFVSVSLCCFCPVFPFLELRGCCLLCLILCILRGAVVVCLVRLIVFVFVGEGVVEGVFVSVGMGMGMWVGVCMGGGVGDEV